MKKEEKNAGWGGGSNFNSMVIFIFLKVITQILIPLEIRRIEEEKNFPGHSCTPQGSFQVPF